MSTSRTRQRNNTIAGLFVLAAIVGFVVMVIILSDLGHFASTQVVRIAVPLDLGVPGVKVGSDVMVGGMSVGKVTAMSGELNQPEPRFIVTVAIPSEYQIREDAFAGMVVPLIGGATAIDISPLGVNGPPLDAEFFRAGGTIRGGYAPSVLLKTAGMGPEDLQRVKDIIRRVDGITEDVKEITAFARTTVNEDGPRIVENIRTTIEDIRAVIAEARQKWPAWSERIAQILEDVRATMERGPALAEKAQTLLDNVDAGVGEVRTLVADVSPNVKATAENVAEVTRWAREEGLARVESTFDQADEALAQATTTFTIINENLTTELPQVSRILANLRLSSDNLKLASTEIRAQPWRVLYTPGKEEVKQSLLHDAVRTYAAAVSDLEASVVSLKALHDRYGPDLDPESDLVQRALSEFEARYERYQQEEKRWGEILFGTGGKP
ncbi:MAG: hypothetical protein KJZ69_07710 [Phycisphaerales bacterium]|nr:hypothetical protein [Phycisphaerales bacterium]